MKHLLRTASCGRATQAPAERGHGQRERRGAAVVEMALVLPIFFMVVLGVIEFGRAMMVGQLVSNAAREAARMGTFDDSSNSEIVAWIQDFLNDAVGVDAQYVTVDITVTPAEGNPDPQNEVANAETGDLVSIEVSVPFDQVSYLAPDYLSNKQLVGRAAMRHE